MFIDFQAITAEGLFTGSGIKQNHFYLDSKIHFLNIFLFLKLTWKEQFILICYAMHTSFLKDCTFSFYF